MSEKGENIFFPLKHKMTSTKVLLCLQPKDIKGIQKYILFLPVVLFINLDCFGVSCLFSNIVGVNGALNVVLTASKKDI